MILADADTTADGTLNERTYFVQNWRHDVVATLDASGRATSFIDYTPYGEPIDVLTADFDKDGEVDLGDNGVFSTQFGTTDCGPSGCTGDFDRDGDVDMADFGTFGTEFGGVYADTLGTLPAAARSRGYAGYVRDDHFGLDHTRFRAYRADLATWLTRDPAEYADNSNLRSYVRSSPIVYIDPSGLGSDLSDSNPEDRPKSCLSTKFSYDSTDDVQQQLNQLTQRRWPLFWGAQLELTAKMHKLKFSATSKTCQCQDAAFGWGDTTIEAKLEADFQLTADVGYFVDLGFDEPGASSRLGLEASASLFAEGRVGVSLSGTIEWNKCPPNETHYYMSISGQAFAGIRGGGRGIASFKLPGGYSTAWSVRASWEGTLYADVALSCDTSRCGLRAVIAGEHGIKIWAGRMHSFENVSGEGNIVLHDGVHRTHPMATHVDFPIPHELLNIINFMETAK